MFYNIIIFKFAKQLNIKNNMKEDLTPDIIESVFIKQEQFANQIQNYLKNHPIELHNIILDAIQFGYHLD